MDISDSLGSGLARFTPSHDDYLWLKLLHARCLTYTETHDWRTQSRRVEDLVDLGQLLYEESSSDGERIDLFFERDELLVYISVGMRTGWLKLHVAGDRRDKKPQIEKLVTEIRDLFPETVADAEIPVIFWYREEESVKSLQRMLAAPAWQEVRHNYSSATRAGLDRLMDGFRPEARGQLLLWHGLPGTGKTWSLRALAREWKDWCWFEYVTDPDAFFGSADYMMHVLIEGNDRRRGPGRRGKEDPWRLLILEDTGEMLAADAKSREGQKLSRLLNVVDGFIGQGLKVLILVTTNEELGALHPAVSRPGRCGALVEFVSFPPNEAADWLAARGSLTLEVPAARSLAELYATAEGLTDRPRKHAIGFAPAAAER
jgi:hypothetical protein